MLLAGPIVRRAEAERVHVWLASSAAASPSIRVVDAGDSALAEIGRGEAASVRLGIALWVHLLTAIPNDGAFPVGRLLGYDIDLHPASGGPMSLADCVELHGAGGIAYGGFPFPTFFVAGGAGPVNLIHGSCRMLHGGGEDAMQCADEALAAHANDPARRPGALFLTGDQIYGDDVAGPLVLHLRELAEALMGPGDDTSVPGVPALSSLPLYGRDSVMRSALKFTSDKGFNHIMSFGEYAAMYLLAWNGGAWPPDFPAFEEAAGSYGIASGRTGKWRRKWDGEIRRLNRSRAALGAVRRVLANVPTYMMFDDHDVTDDWNLSMAWRDDVRASAAGRRVVAHALAAFWAFQGWGNNPDDHDDDLRQTITRFLANQADAVEFEETLWNFDMWSFIAPTQPRTLFLDTRTQRSYDSQHGAARLVGPAGRKRLAGLVRQSAEESDGNLVVVSAVPLVGLELQERRQKFLVKELGPYAIDFEAWNSNLHGLLDFMEFCNADAGLDCCIFLSGDVHYGMNVRFVHSSHEGAISIAQFVSSGQKHSDVAARMGLDLLGRLVKKNHERIGWRSTPHLGHGSLPRKTANRIMLRRPNTDSWSKDGPVMLTPRRARQLKILDPPEFRQIRKYVRPDGPNRSFLVGENNMGLIIIAGDEVTHRLMSRGDEGCSFHTATLEVKPAAPDERL